jgi:hypothetical protein
VAKKAAATEEATPPARNLPAKRAASSPIKFDAADAGAGFEGAGSAAYAIPFLTILQSMSPQCKKSDGAYIKGAEEGMFYNTVANEVYPGDEPLEIIPCGFTQTFIEWGLREKGGGYVAEYDSVAGASLRAQCRRDDKGRDILPNGHQLNDHRNHYVLYKDGDGNWQQALISITSTQIKASRNWMSLMLRLASTHKAPMFGLVFNMTTTAQSNDKGSWYGWVFEHDGFVQDEETYAKAKAFHQQVKTGNVKTSPRDAPGEPAPDADDPDSM